MTRRLFFFPALLLSLTVFTQPTFYIQNGNRVTKVENGDPAQLNVKEWQVRLYKKGASTSGTSYWGTIKGSSASEVMEMLKKQQQFELDFNKFIGKGNVEDEVYTHFNPLGPITVTDTPKASELPLTDAQKKVADLYEKTTDLFYTGLDVKNNLDVIIKGKENPYADIGSNFMQYSEGIKDAVLQIRTLQNLLFKNSTTTLQNINKQLADIDRKLTNTQTKLTKATTALNNTNTVQKPIDAIEETLQKELAKQTTQPKINPTQTGISYFIFLTADISVAPQQSLFSNLQTPKHLHVISKPIWYTQNQTDENSVKETFLREIEKQLKNLDKDFYKNYSRNNYEAVGYINTNFKESIPLLNNQQCQEAIVNYKNIILNIDQNSEFIQL